MLTARHGIAFEIFPYFGGAALDLLHGAADVFGSLPDIVIDPCDRGLPHPIDPQDPGPEPLGVLDQEMKRRALDGNSRALEPHAQLGEYIVDEAFVARLAC